MATIYVSYKLEDQGIAREIADALDLLGHRAIYDAVALLPGTNWRDVLLDAQSHANATIVILTERALSSPFVMGEIGAARALNHNSGRMLLLPVLVGDIGIPPVISDLFVVRMGQDEDGVRRAASEIDKALLQGLGGDARGPRVFISHRHRDAEIAQALVRLIEASFRIDSRDLRCTSVPPYRLRAGERTGDRLRTEIKQAEAVLGILTPNTRDSSYVLFELGASWGRGVVTFPLLALGTVSLDVPAPIGDLHTLTLSDEADCHQLIDDLADVTSLHRRENSGAAISERVRVLIKSAQGSISAL
jgi:hypothetical protein